MKCVLLTLFPEMVRPHFDHSILKRAREKGLLDVEIVSLRDFGMGKHHVTDDVPYGGGPGMVLKPEPIFAALEAIRKTHPAGDFRVLVPSPSGVVFHHAMAFDFSKEEKVLVFICGRYEGIDARVLEGIAGEEISVGDYVLTGGELPALLMIDAAMRLIPGVLGATASLEEESFSQGMLDYPHYTRPEVFQGMKVPEVLLSGNHAAIEKWRREAAFLNTQNKRPDLLTSAK
ncbi:MAG: tRNA (guanosine(37)-N1)-methyltransferase TrmD [Nitrospirota bacterium]